MSHIFVSHTTADDDVVSRLHDALEAATGQNLWVDHKDILPGENWQNKIETALAGASRMLVALSASSAASNEVLAEWRDAMLRGIPVIPILIEELPLTTIPSRLRLNQFVRLYQDESFAIAQLAAAIRGEAAPDAPRFIGLHVTGRIDRVLTSLPLQGRQEDLAAVLRQLPQQPVFIVGIGGRGKSRLAAEVAFRGEGFEGVVWHYALEFYTADDLLSDLRLHLNLDGATERRDVFKYIRMSPPLVVLDNAESIAEANRAAYAALLEDVFAAGGRVLVTTRERWHEMGVVSEIAPGALTAEQAAAIVHDMARLYHVKADLSEAALAIAEGARRHPRLIEAAVRQTTQLPVDVVLNNLKGLSGREIHKSLEKMIRLSFEQMTGKAGAAPLAALRRLCVMRGGFTYAAARALCLPDVGEYAAPAPPELVDEDALQSALSALQDWHFLYLDAAERYQLDPLAAEIVEQEQADEAAYAAHFDYCIETARRAQQAQRFAELDAEIDNLEAAFERLLQRAPTRAFYLARTCSFFLANRGRYEKRMAWLNQLQAVLGDSRDRHMRAQLLQEVGIVQMEHPLGDRRANTRRSIEALEEALELRDANVSALAYASTCNNLGNAYRNLALLENPVANLERSIAAYATALQYRTPEESAMGYAATQNNLGVAYRELATFDQPVRNLYRAIDAFNAALRYRNSQQHPLTYAATQNNLGTTYRELANYEEPQVNLARSVAAYQESLRYRTLADAPLDHAMTQINLGMAYRQWAMYEEREANLARASACHAVAQAVVKPERDPLKYAWLLTTMGDVDQDRGDRAAAVARWREAEAYYRTAGLTAEADEMVRRLGA
jgi:tetratricopeptide (TPR) repeat protein